MDNDADERTHQLADKKDPIRIERWTSDDNRDEIHFFVKNDNSKYIMGYNPAYFDKEVIIKLLKNAGFVTEYYAD